MKPNSFVRHFLSHKGASYLPAQSLSAIRHSFAALENDFDISPKVKNALRTFDPSSLTHYPDRNATELTKVSAKWLGIRPSMIMVGNGSDEIISRIVDAFIEPQQTIVVQTPTFFRIPDAIFQRKGRVVAVPALRKNGFALDRDFGKRLVANARKHRAGIIWLCSPNNPTGAVMNRDVIAWIASHTSALVIVDEAYQELHDPKNRESAVSLISAQNNVIVTKTFSKAFGLAGLRVGLLIAHPDVITTMDACRLNFPVSSISLALAAAALEDTDHLKRVCRQVSAERTRLFRAIRSLPSLEIGAESKTNVFILRHKTRNLHALLLAQDILTADFNRMNGLEGMRFVRITVKRHKENLALIKALRTVCGKGTTI